mmetsp:Transcript_28314/g.80834  ORF Transcript_28314/g.80834 Transcript_28314/m.80834 type:complete len:83 (-) Transcript_28314:73-321(-)
MHFARKAPKNAAHLYWAFVLSGDQDFERIHIAVHSPFLGSTSGKTNAPRWSTQPSNRQPVSNESTIVQTGWPCAKTQQGQKQ